MARKPDIGNVQIYPNRPLRQTDKNGYQLKFYCPIRRSRIRRNCGARDRREARCIQRECRNRLLNGEYEKSGGAITADDAKLVRMAAPANKDGKLWEEAVASYQDKFKGRSKDHVVSRLSLAERIFENRRKTLRLPPGLLLSECLTDDSIDYLQERLLAGEECRYKMRASSTVNSIVRNVMTFARFCKRKKWIPRIPDVERVGTDEDEEAMKGRPITTEEFERMLESVPKIVHRLNCPLLQSFLRHCVLVSSPSPFGKSSWDSLPFLDDQELREPLVEDGFRGRSKPCFLEILWQGKTNNQSPRERQSEPYHRIGRIGRMRASVELDVGSRQVAVGIRRGF